MDGCKLLSLLLLVDLAITPSQGQLNQNEQRRRFSGRRTSGDALDRAGRTSCTDVPQCGNSERESRFRSADGSCNNLEHGDWGQALVAMRRFIPSAYGDRVSRPRTKSASGQKLPSARTVSYWVHEEPDTNQPTEARITHMVMQWGQFLDHDITFTPIQAQEDLSSLICCQDDVDPAVTSDSAYLNNVTLCFPIEVPDDDPAFPGRTCIGLTRSVQTINAACDTNGPVEQLNLITAYIDASNVYGSSEAEQLELRGAQTYLLLSNNEKLLPEDAHAHAGESCAMKQAHHYCFLAGDARVNAQPALSSMHTLWMKTHNKIAEALLALDNGWDHERVFQEARKIVGAMMQQITFDQWLPVVVGDTAMDKYKLKLGNRDQRPQDPYNPNTDASIMNSFATAAFRFGHSLIGKEFSRYSPTYTHEGSDDLKDMFGDSGVIIDQTSNVGSFLRGLASDSAMEGDKFLTTQVTNHLFETAEHSFDLASLNIQRGRDHGLPPYNEFRQKCGFKKFKTWADLETSGKMATGTIEELKLSYRSPKDIDLFTGGLSENKIPGAVIGETFACILGNQFRKLKQGDRYWFQRPGREGFTSDQLAEIRKVTLASILCYATNTVEIQPNVFLNKDVAGNGLKLCTDIYKLDLNKWRNGGGRIDGRGGRGR